MKQKMKADLTAQLDRLGEEWADAQGPENEAARKKLQNDIFCAVYELYPRQEDAINQVFVQDWQRYDPRLGTLSGFFARRIPMRGKDLASADRGERLLTETDPATGEKKRRRKRVFEQEPDTRENAPETPGRNAWVNAPDNEDTPEESLGLDASACALISVILDLSSLLEGRSNNPQRRRYFRMFFTDGISAYLHKSPVPDIFTRRERDLFDALYLPFLDFFLSAECRTAPAIQAAPLKLYGEMVEGKPMEEAEHPLGADVFLSFLDRAEHYKAGGSALSTQRAAYTEFLKKCLF